MKRSPFGWCWLLLITVLALAPSAGAAETPPGNSSLDTTHLIISGHILDQHHEPIRDAQILVLIGGRPAETAAPGAREVSLHSLADGTFLIETNLAEAMPPDARVTLDIRKTSFKPLLAEIPLDDFARRGNNFFLEKNFTLQRLIGPAFWIATLVLLGVYALITFELLHRTIVASSGRRSLWPVLRAGAINPAYHIISFATAVQKIDLNVIFLLMGMIVIVGVLKESGIFQWSAARCFQLARETSSRSASSHDPDRRHLGFLDNVTTMLLVVPVTIESPSAWRFRRWPFSFPRRWPPTSRHRQPDRRPAEHHDRLLRRLTFMQFIQHLSILCLIVLVPLFLVSKFFYGEQYHKARVADPKASPAPSRKNIRSPTGLSDRRPAGADGGSALFSPTVSGIWSKRRRPVRRFLFFTFALATGKVNCRSSSSGDRLGDAALLLFLFMIVGAVEETVLVALIADSILRLSHRSLTASIYLVLWGSAIMSAFVDNIPFTATMLPITAFLTQAISGAQSRVLWWALALGACLGGNGAMIGASANVVTVGIAEARGYHITFLNS